MRISVPIKQREISDKSAISLLFFAWLVVILLFDPLIRFISHLVPPSQYHLPIFIWAHGDNARYILSALSQAQAAIFGLFFTLIFIVTQIQVQNKAASPYDMRKQIKSKRLYFIFMLFITSITIDLVLLRYAPLDNDIGINILGVLILSVICVLLLLHYMGAMIVSIFDNSIKEEIRSGNARYNLRGAELAFTELPNAQFEFRDLSRANLNNANLKNANLKNAILWDANLTGARLKGADLTGAYLWDASLTGANLTGANLGDANLTDANLEGAYLTGANLGHAHLSDANLTGAHLGGANLTEANLTGARLTNAGLWHANLKGANLWHASLMAANLTKADLTEANLTGANLIKADLTEANLTGANLTKADLTEANLKNAGMIEARLEGTNLTDANQEGVIRTLNDLQDVASR